MIKLFLTFFLLSSTVYAQMPTVVFGAAEDQKGQQEGYLVVQPENAPNPLGSPIVGYPDTQTPDTLNEPREPDARENADQNTIGDVDQVSARSLKTGQALQNQGNIPQNIVRERLNQYPVPFSETPEQEQQQIENTLYESGNRIYDLQSYPLEDIKTITEPNIDPTVTDYPSY